MFLGTIFIVFGLAMLLKNLGLITGGIWDVVWPTLLVVLGVSLLARRSRMHHIFGCDCQTCRSKNQ